MQNKNTRRGFTLIELLVVVLIIGVLAAVAVPQYQKAVEKSRLTEALQNIKAIQTCFDLYKLEHGLPSQDEDGVSLADMNCPVEANLGEWHGEDDEQYPEAYVSKYFEYHGPGCSSVGCFAEISPIPSYAYTLVMDSDRSENTCWTQDTDLGRYICKSIEKQGWAYMDEGY